MLTLPRSVRIWLAAEPVDMRRGHDGLAVIVHSQWEMDLYSGHLFVFIGKQKDRVKILCWDRGGFVLFYKRLERGVFRIPRVESGSSSVEIDGTALSMLLDGIDLRRVQRPSHWEPPKKSP